MENMLLSLLGLSQSIYQHDHTTIRPISLSVSNFEARPISVPDFPTPDFSVPDFSAADLEKLNCKAHDRFQGSTRVEMNQLIPRV